MSLSTRYNPAEIEARRYACGNHRVSFMATNVEMGPTYAISLSAAKRDR